MFDFRRATVFLFGTPLLKAQNDQICYKLWGAWPPRLPWLRLCMRQWTWESRSVKWKRLEVTVC